MATTTTTPLYGNIGRDEGILSRGDPDEILAQIARIRKHRAELVGQPELASDPVSDQIWLRRIQSGNFNFGDVRFRIDQKFGTSAQTVGSVGGSVGTVGEAADIGDASAYLEALLRQYGLGDLLGWAMDQLREGRTEDEIIQQLYDPSTEAGQAFDERFPAIRARQEAGLPPLRPAEYIEYEETAGQLARESGLPQDIMDVDDLLAKNVSLRELSARVEEGFERVMELPQEVRDEFGSLFGARGDEALAALFLDPDRALPDLERQVSMAEVAGAGSIMGFSVGSSSAEELARFGFSFDQALANFRTAAQLRPLSQELTFERTDLTDDDLVGGSFGVDADSLESIRKRQEGRVAPFQSGDQARAGDRGFLGAGRPV